MNRDRLSTLLPGPRSEPAQPEAPRELPATSRRTSVALLLGVLLLGIAAVGAYAVFISGGAGPGSSQASSVTSTASRSRGPSASRGAPATVTSATATSSKPNLPGAAATGRNPFVPIGGADATTGGASGSASASTTTSTATSTGTVTYVGLYAFSGTKATFWVNDQEYQVAPGGTFAGFTYASKSSSTCAKLSKSGTTTQICVGTVKQLA